MTLVAHLGDVAGTGDGDQLVYQTGGVCPTLHRKRFPERHRRVGSPMHLPMKVKFMVSPTKPTTLNKRQCHPSPPDKSSPLVQKVTYQQQRRLRRLRWPVLRRVDLVGVIPRAVYKHPAIRYE